MADFYGYPKIARYNREVVATEKIDGTNAQLYIDDDGKLWAGSRNRWLTPDDDNHGFARWALEHKDELLALGPGRHYGEWWGGGIERKYGLGKDDKRLSLFYSTATVVLPPCVGLVPVLWRGLMQDLDAEYLCFELERYGSKAAPGFMRPEGIVIYHTASGTSFKKTLERDEQHKVEEKK